MMEVTTNNCVTKRREQHHPVNTVVVITAIY